MEGSEHKIRERKSEIGSEGSREREIERCSYGEKR